MKISMLLRLALAGLFFATTASAQNAGTVTQYAFAIGKGAGQTGLTSLLCGSAQLAVGQSAAAPICRTITGDVTITSAGATAIGAAKVTSAMLRDSAALSVIGRSANSSGVPADIAAGTDGHVLRRASSTLAWGTIDLSSANTVGSSILGLANGGTGAALTANTGGIVYSDSDSMEVLANPGSTGRLVQAQNAAAPIWTTSSYPSASGAGTVLAALSANTITATRAPVIGLAGTATGTLGFSGTTSGTVTVQPQAAAGTYNFNLPITAGTSGQPLLSGGGGSTAQTYGTLGAAAGGTGVANNAANTLTWSGNFASTFTLTGVTGVTFPTSGTLATLAGPTFTGTVAVSEALTLSGDITPTQIVANTNDYAPTGFSTATVLRLSTDASRNITGLAGGADGRIIVVYNVGAQNIVLKAEDAASSAANRFSLSGDVTLSALQGLTLAYDPTGIGGGTGRWRMIGSNPSAAGGGGGDFVGPASSTDNAAVRFDGTTGKLGQNSALIIADTTGAISRTGGGGIGVEATNSNTNPGAAEVGNFQSSNILVGSAVALPTNTATDVTSISLGAGNWLLYGNIVIQTGAGTMTTANVWLGTASVTEPTRPNFGGQTFLQGLSVAGGSDYVLTVGTKRISQSGTATHYLSARQLGSTGSPVVYGFIGAIRLP